MNFIDLQYQYFLYKEEIQTEIDKVLSSAQFIMGPVLAELEKELADYCGVKHAIGCSSGTDALLLGLMAKGVQRGDEIIVPDFTFIATAEMISFIGAVPVFVDIKEDTYNLDPTLLEAKITPRTKGIIPVSLFGQCADFNAIGKIAAKHGLWVMEDAAQSFGAISGDKKSGNLTEMAATSFFPAKPLGCYGDGGAVFTNDDKLAALVRTYLNHGQNERYKHKYIGINGRLDALQAAILRVKLRHFDEEIGLKQQAAARYTEQLAGAVITPVVQAGNSSVWAQYSVQSKDRGKIIDHLTAKGIPTAVHYPIPLHQQEAFGYLKTRDTFPVADKVSQQIFSLPMHPFLTAEQITLITDSIREALA